MVDLFLPSLTTQRKKEITSKRKVSSPEGDHRVSKIRRAGRGTLSSAFTIKHPPSGFLSKSAFPDSSPLPTFSTQNGQPSNQGTSNNWPGNQISPPPVISDIAGWMPELVMSDEMSSEPSSSMPTSTSQAQYVGPESSLFEFSSDSEMDDDYVEESQHSSVGKLDRTPLSGHKKQTFFSPSPRELKIAPSGRPYRQWDESEKPESTFGAFIPDGYQKSDNVELPWICPVRSCRTLFAGLKNLGFHFNSAHNGAKLNDNLDGTLSETGSGVQDYVIKNGRGKSTMVVSQGPLSLSDFPLAEPRLPSKTKHRAEVPGPGVTRKNSTAGYSYDTWIDPTGRQIDTHGALIPKAYKLLDSVPGRPWICSIRSCRRLYKTIADLGTHFKTDHKGCQLNDNGDGTLSILMTIDEDREENPAIVVSSNPLKSTEPAMLRPQPSYETEGFEFICASPTTYTPRTPSKSQPRGPLGSALAKLSNHNSSVQRRKENLKKSTPTAGPAWDSVSLFVASTPSTLKDKTIQELSRLSPIRSLD